MFFNSNWLLIQLLIALFCCIKKGSRLSLSLAVSLPYGKSVVLDVYLFIIISGWSRYVRSFVAPFETHSLLLFPCLYQYTANAPKKRFEIQGEIDCAIWTVDLWIMDSNVALHILEMMIIIIIFHVHVVPDTNHITFGAHIFGFSPFHFFTGRFVFFRFFYFVAFLSSHHRMRVKMTQRNQSDHFSDHHSTGVYYYPLYGKQPSANRASNQLIVRNRLVNLQRVKINFR